MPLNAELFNGLKNSLAKKLMSLQVSHASGKTHALTVVETADLHNMDTGEFDTAHGLSLTLITTDLELRDTLRAELNAWLRTKGIG